MFGRVLLFWVVFVAAFVNGPTLGAQQPAPAAPPPGAAAPMPGPGARGGGRGAPPVKSPEVGADRRVTFRLRALNAKEVAVMVAGKRLSMQTDDQGVWSVTTDPLDPDYYTYSLVVDGTSINDPSNRQAQTSFGSFQSMFVVPGSQLLARPMEGSRRSRRATNRCRSDQGGWVLARVLRAGPVAGGGVSDSGSSVNLGGGRPRL